MDRYIYNFFIIEINKLENKNNIILPNEIINYIYELYIIKNQYKLNFLSNINFKYKYYDNIYKSPVKNLIYPYKYMRNVSLYKR